VENLGKVLALDDDLSFLGELKIALEDFVTFNGAGKVTEAMRAMVNDRPDLVLLDMNMPEVTGLEFLRVLKQRAQGIPVIMLTAESDPDIIVQTMKAGADDFVVKGSPDFLASLRVRISQALKLSKVKKLNEALSSKLKEAESKYEILGISPSTIKLRADIAKFKGANAYVLILGENGSGKELVARNLNLQENDPSRPFVAVNCGAIPAELFESELFGHVKGSFTGAVADRTGLFVQANGGDIFLDEIGELPPDLQVKLLRVLQNKEVTPIGSTKTIKLNVRVIAATNQKLEELVSDGKFRSDLFFRINQLVLQTTPLREHPEDILFLARHFADCTRRLKNG